METYALAHVLPDRTPTIRAGAALVLANARYWSFVAPTVRRELVRWERRARSIPDTFLRALALEKIHTERFNAEVAATLATLAPRCYRSQAVEAIVALETMYDYLDGLTEMPTNDPLRNGRQLSTAFTDALTPRIPRRRDYFRYHPSDDDGYLAQLSDTVRTAFTHLPSARMVAGPALLSASRCSEAQVQVNAVPQIGTARLQRWAKEQAPTSAMNWRTYTAGAAASVLAVHALIAAAADSRTTQPQARAIDRAYLSISALSTILDSLVDYEQDHCSESRWCLDNYNDSCVLASDLSHLVASAKAQARHLPRPGHHVMTLAGVIAYYTSAPSAANDFARPLVRQIQSELRPLITPTLSVMRTWRAAKSFRRWLTRKLIR